MKFLSFTRCFYTFSNQIFSHHQQSSSFWTLYYIDLLLTLYATPRLLYIIYLMLSCDPKCLAPLFQVDPTLHFLVTAMDPTTCLLVLLYELIHFYYKIALTRIQLHSPVWRFWREVIVKLQEHYFRCALDREKLLLVHSQAAKQKLELITQICKWCYWLPNCFLLVAARLSSQLLIWRQLQNIDKRQFLRKKKSINCTKSTLPTLSSKVKRRTVLVLLAIDKIVCFMFVCDGNFW